MSETREARNEIFGAGDKQHTPTPPMQATNDVPVESVPLPSSGIVYPTDGVLHGRLTVDIRSMTAREEDILTSRALLKKGTVITELLKSCLMDKSIDVRSLLSGDRNAIMVALRITGYGAEYVAEVACPSCSETSKQEFDLSALPIKRLGISPVADGLNEFEFKLPVSGARVTFRFLTGSDEEEITLAQERKKKLGNQVDNLVTTKLTYCLLSVNEKRDRSYISNFVRNMPARDSLMLRRYIDDNEPGIDMKGWINCNSCGHSEEVAMPMGASFFWPDAGR